MSQESRQKLTLDRPVTYQIKVPGELVESWSDWIGDITISIENGEDGLSVSILTVTVDQAALQGLLRRLYSLGLPLISVILIDYS
jgi:hypothetical protein